MPRTSRKQNTLTQTVSNHTLETSTQYKTALYLRLSMLDSGKKDSNTIVNQQDLLTKYVNDHHDLSLTDTFIDNGETGTNFSRPAWTQLMVACKQGKINCIVVKDLSRVGRNYIETEEFLEVILPSMGVRLIAVNDDYDTINNSSSKRLVGNLKNLVNDIYSKDLSRKVSVALATKQKNGEFIGNFAAYGYLKDPSNKNKLIVDKEASLVVKQIFQWKAVGVSNTAICRKLNDGNIPSPAKYRLQKGILKSPKYENSMWYTRTLVDLLNSVVYLGHLAQGKHTGYIYKGQDRKKTKSDEWIVVENTHEPIIDKDLFDRVQLVMAEQTEKYNKRRGAFAHIENPPILLQGLVFCADCGKRLYRYRNVRGKGKFVDYIFSCRTSETSNSCSKKYIHEHVLNTAVFSAIKNEINKCINLSTLFSKLSANKAGTLAIKPLELKIDEIEKGVSRIGSFKQGIFEDYATKLITKDEYNFAIKKYDTETKELKKRLDKAKKEKKAIIKADKQANKYLDEFSFFQDEAFLTSAMAQALISRIEISSRDKVSITFNFRDELMALNHQLGNEVAI